MSFKIGQLRRNQISSYQNEIPLIHNTSIGIKQHSTETGGTSSIRISDGCLLLESPLKKNVNYYFTFHLKGNNSGMKSFTMTLYGEGKEQPIKYFNNMQAGEYGELVFTPNDNIYSKIVFKLANRTTNIGQVYIDDSVDKNSLLTKVHLYELTNVIPKLEDVSYIQKLGLQGPPGLMFSMNGEEIHIGKSGIYEVEGININNLSFVIKEGKHLPYSDGKDFFIMDYLY